MINRIVQMTFEVENIPAFLTLFEQSKEKIRNFPGVQHLELLQDTQNPQTFFTYSHWDSEESLENYRHSDLFKGVWSNTKPLFSEKAKAWSTNCLHRLG